MTSTHNEAEKNVSIFNALSFTQAVLPDFFLKIS